MGPCLLAQRNLELKNDTVSFLDLLRLGIGWWIGRFFDTYRIGPSKSTIGPLPLLKEQHEIVRRVEKLFDLADKIEQHLTQTRHVWTKSPKPFWPRRFEGS